MRTFTVRDSFLCVCAVLTFRPLFIIALYSALSCYSDFAVKCRKLVYRKTVNEFGFCLFSAVSCFWLRKAKRVKHKQIPKLLSLVVHCVHVLLETNGVCGEGCSVHNNLEAVWRKMKPPVLTNPLLHIGVFLKGKFSWKWKSVIYLPSCRFKLVWLSLEHSKTF